MLKEAVFTTLILTLPSSAAIAAVYKCTVNSQAVFSDEPCGKDSQEIDHQPAPAIGGRFDTGTDAEFFQPEKRANKSSNSSCSYIDTTRLRRLVVQNKITRGMKPADVRRSWGSPSSINTGGSSIQWAYHYPDYSSSYVYFEEGCVSSWSGYYR